MHLQVLPCEYASGKCLHFDRCIDGQGHAFVGSGEIFHIASASVIALLRTGIDIVRAATDDSMKIRHLLNIYMDRFGGVIVMVIGERTWPNKYGSCPPMYKIAD
ncbi:hypothetical protein ASE26_29365 [Duganella sp. Root198D2]|nr:hypothetical protein ASE26_29365 [Duganella sp. Root198D2]